MIYTCLRFIRIVQSQYISKNGSVIQIQINRSTHSKYFNSCQEPCSLDSTWRWVTGWQPLMTVMTSSTPKVAVCRWRWRCFSLRPGEIFGTNFLCFFFCVLRVLFWKEDQFPRCKSWNSCYMGFHKLNPLFAWGPACLWGELTAEKVSAKNFTWSQRKTSSSETYKSAIIEHVATSNHIINWDKAKIIDQEADKTTRWLKEAIWIRSRGKDTMNMDEGAYKLDRIYDQIIYKRQPLELMTSSQSSRVASQ